jgi:hypothetical protein
MLSSSLHLAGSCVITTSGVSSFHFLSLRAGHEGVAGLEAAEGWDWRLKHLVNACIGLMGVPSYLIMMSIGLTFAYFGPLPVIP